jgi:outer membrane protein TolC
MTWNKKPVVYLAIATLGVVCGGVLFGDQPDKLDEGFIESLDFDPATKEPVEQDTAIEKDKPLAQDITSEQDKLVESDNSLENQWIEQAADVWWDSQVVVPKLDSENWVTFDLGTVLVDTLEHSPEIRIASRETQIATERVVQRQAEFDAGILFDTGYKRLNDPVGNSLTTGGPTRLIETGLNSSGGITKRTTNGGSLDLSQSFGLQQSNSRFFLPADQANSRLTLGFTQPLFDRAGTAYNQRLVTQAQIEYRITWSDVRTRVEKRIADTNEAYWSLYGQRCSYIQFQSLRERLLLLEQIARARQPWDASRLSIAKVQSRLAQVDDRLIQIASLTAKYQAELARLVNSPDLIAVNVDHEMVPTTRPMPPAPVATLDSLVRDGIENRGEVRQAAAAIENASLQVQVTRTELTPQLNAVVGGYLAGLKGDFDAARSFGSQFSEGGPGLSAGVNYDMPLGRRSARSRHREAMQQISIARESFEQALGQVRFEIETAKIEYEATRRRLALKRSGLMLAKEEESILQSRFTSGIEDVTNVGTVIESLLDVHQQRTEAETEVSDCLVKSQIALVRLRQAAGTLLQYQEIETVQSGGEVQFIRNPEETP